MERWCMSENEMSEVKEVDVLLNEIIALCKKHNLSIGHEDERGGFVIHNGFNQDKAEWLMDAAYQKEPS